MHSEQVFFERVPAGGSEGAIGAGEGLGSRVRRQVSAQDLFAIPSPKASVTQGTHQRIPTRFASHPLGTLENSEFQRGTKESVVKATG